MKIAVIDLGTNTFHLLIAEASAAEVHILYKTNVPVRLGEGRINENTIIPEAFERGIQTLKNFRQTIMEMGATDVHAVATSAIRSAANGPDFVQAAKQRAGIDIQVINGEQEAGYIFEGVKATGVIDNTSLIMDIGGGSTEFIICNPSGLLWKKSYNVGAARLMQAYFNTDPISKADQQAIIAHLDLELKDLKIACLKYRPLMLIGSAGAFETFFGMISKEHHLPESLRSAPIDIQAYEELAETLINSIHAQRDKMPGLIKLRVDMIVIAAILTNYVISNCKTESMNLSTYDLKMGVLHSLISKN